MQSVVKILLGIFAFIFINENLEFYQTYLFFVSEIV